MPPSPEPEAAASQPCKSTSPLPISTLAHRTPELATPIRSHSHTSAMQQSWQGGLNLAACGSHDELLVKELSSPCAHGSLLGGNEHTATVQHMAASQRHGRAQRARSPVQSANRRQQLRGFSLPHTPLCASVPLTSRQQSNAQQAHIKHGSLDVTVPAYDSILPASESYRMSTGGQAHRKDVRASCPAACATPDQSRHVQESRAGEQCCRDEHQQAHTKTLGSKACYQPHQISSGPAQNTQWQEQGPPSSLAVQASLQSVSTPGTMELPLEANSIESVAAAAPEASATLLHAAVDVADQMGVNGINAAAAHGGIQADEQQQTCQEAVQLCVSAEAFVADAKAQVLPEEEAALIDLESGSDCASAAEEAAGDSARDDGQLGSILSMDSSEAAQFCNMQAASSDHTPAAIMQPAPDVVTEAAQVSREENAAVYCTPAVVSALSPADAALAAASLEVHGGRGALDSAALCTSSASGTTSTQTLSPATKVLLQMLQNVRGAAAVDAGAPLAFEMHKC